MTPVCHREKCENAATVAKNVRWCLIAPLAVLFAAQAFVRSACAAAPSGARVTYITGQVTDEVTHAPLANVSVSVFRPGAGPEGTPSFGQSLVTTRTLTNGSFVLTLMEGGSFQLRADAPGYQPVSQTVLASAGKASTVKLEMARPPAPRIRLEMPRGTLPKGTPIQTWMVIHPTSTPTRAIGSWSSATVVADQSAEIKLQDGFPTLASDRVDLAVRAAGYGVSIVQRMSWKSFPLDVALKPGISLTGTVVDSKGDGVPDARVRLSGFDPALPARFLEGWASAKADTEGHFRFDSLLPGRYAVEGDRPGGGIEIETVDAVPANVTIGPQSPSWPDIPMAPADPTGHGQSWAPINWPPGAPAAAAAANARTIHGYIYAEDNSPLTGLVVAVVVASPTSTPIDVTRTRPDGSFQLQAPADGRYRVETDPHGPFVPMSTEIKVSGRSVHLADVSLARCPVLHLKITGPAQTKIGGTDTRVFLSGLHKSEPFAAEAPGRIAADGSLEIRAPYAAPAAGISNLTVDIECGSAGAGRAELPAWPVGTTRVSLSQREIAGRVLDDEGDPVAGAVVSADWLSAPGLDPIVQRVAQTSSDVHGAFRLAGLFRGSFSLTLDAPEMLSSARIVAVDPGKGSPQELTLSVARGSPLRGRVLDEAGVGAQGAVVRLYAAPDLLNYGYIPVTAQRITGRDGEFEVSGLKRGEYLVCVVLPDGRSERRIVRVPTTAPDIVLTPADHL